MTQAVHRQYTGRTSSTFKADQGSMPDTVSAVRLVPMPHFLTCCCMWINTVSAGVRLMLCWCMVQIMLAAKVSHTDQ